MTTTFKTFALSLVCASGLGACTRTSPNGAESPTSEQQATLSMMLLAGQDLSGAPNLYEISVLPAAGATPVVRGGDLPRPGQVLTIANLPVSPAAELEGGLYKTRIDSKTRTHSCKGDAPVALTAGQTATASLTCTAVASGEPPIKVFVKVAKATIQITERTSVDVLAARDWSLPLQFGAQEAKGRRASIKQDAHSLTVHVGGDLSYRVAIDPTQQSLSPIARLLAHETLTLTAISGRLLSVAPEDATLTLAAEPVLYEQDSGVLLAALPLKLVNAAGTVGFDATLLEEVAGTEFTVVSYNVENLFDQVDETRNASYGDYRLALNAQGVGSNYGEPVEFEGHTATWTEVKIAGVRKTLIALDPNGPEIVGLVEVESRAAIDQLLAAVQDLGYVSAEFTDWAQNVPAAAIGLGLITKFPVLEKSLLPVVFATDPSQPAPPVVEGGSERPILKVTLDVHGKPFIVYVNHWKSKGGPESMRIACAEAVQRDLDVVLAANPIADYVILGDLNSEYNENVIIEPEHNDSAGRTGINSVIKAQGDELAVVKNTNPGWKYNLHYELDRSARRTAWHEGFNWSALDNMIVGTGVYNRLGISYVDDSFQPVNALMPGLGHLFKADGTTNRWHGVRVGSKYTRHEIGGYSDHLPISARFLVTPLQTSSTIWLADPSRPNADDPAL